MKMSHKLQVVLVGVLLATVTTVAWAGGTKESQASSSQKKVTINFMQWWQNEMDKGTFNAMIGKFEQEHPNITVKATTLPYADVRNQVFTQAAAGNLADVSGLDPQWSFQLAKQGIVADLSPYFDSTSGFSLSNYAGVKKVDGKYLMLPVAVYTYPLFYNKKLFAAAGISAPPKTRADFIADAKKLTNSANHQYGWALPLGLKLANGVTNDTWSWLWSAGGHVFLNGKPDLNTPQMISTLEFIKGLYNDKVIVPGTLTMSEQSKVESFASGTAAMIIDSQSHITVFQRKDPGLSYGITSIPQPAGYSGKSGLHWAGWSAGIAASSAHKQQAWEFLNYLTSESTDGYVAFHANGFPGNRNVKAEAVVPKSPAIIHDLMSKAFDVYSTSNLHAPMVGQPNALELMQAFDREMQRMLLGQITAQQAVEAAQTKWEQIIKNAQNG